MLLSCSGYDCRKSICIVNSQFGKHFSVDLDTVLLESENQLTVLDVVLATASSDASDPKLSEISLLVASVSKCVLPRL